MGLLIFMFSFFLKFGWVTEHGGLVSIFFLFFPQLLRGLLHNTTIFFTRNCDKETRHKKKANDTDL